MVQFIPLTFQPERESDLREVEEINRLKTGVIAKARWIKPIARWVPSQTCGHAIFVFLTPEAANEALTHGLFVCQKKVYVEK